MKRLVLALAFLLSTAAARAQVQPAEGAPSASGCHIFIDYHFIWSLELVPSGSGSIPVLNIITFADGQWDLRPNQIHLDGGFQEAEIKKFAIDTGVPGEPYVVQYLKVHGDSFIGMDLIGELAGMTQLKEVRIELGDSVFHLDPVDCLEFENIAQKINQVNFDSPDIRQDYDVLGISLHGERKARRRFY